MPDWLNWLAAVTGIIGFGFSIWVYFRESRTRRGLEEAKDIFEKQQAKLRQTQVALEGRLDGMNRMVELAEEVNGLTARGRK